MGIVNSSQELMDEIGKIVEDINLISIDGWMGAGKTTLLRQLHDELDYYTFSIDSFLENEKDLYIEAVNYNELKNAMKEKLDSGEKIAIEGVCIKRILNEIELLSDLSIYIKKMGILGWYIEEYIDDSKTPEEIFVEDDEKNKYDIITGEEREITEEEKRTTEKREGLFYDVVRYHFEYKPHINSDIIFDRPYINE